MLEREKRMNLYKDCIKFLKTRVEADIAGFKDIDLWSH
jgi:ribonuclease D